MKMNGDIDYSEKDIRNKLIILNFIVDLYKFFRNLLSEIKRKITESNSSEVAIANSKDEESKKIENNNYIVKEVIILSWIKKWKNSNFLYLKIDSELEEQIGWVRKSMFNFNCTKQPDFNRKQDAMEWNAKK